MAVASLILGIIGLFAWTIPFLGFPITIIGLVLGTIALFRSQKDRGMAIAGTVMCALGFFGSIVNFIIGVVLLFTF